MHLCGGDHDAPEVLLGTSSTSRRGSRAGRTGPIELNSRYYRARARGPSTTRSSNISRRYENNNNHASDTRENRTCGACVSRARGTGRPLPPPARVDGCTRHDCYYYRHHHRQYTFDTNDRLFTKCLCTFTVNLTSFYLKLFAIIAMDLSRGLNIETFRRFWFLGRVKSIVNNEPAEACARRRIEKEKRKNQTRKSARPVRRIARTRRRTFDRRRTTATRETRRGTSYIFVSRRDETTNASCRTDTTFVVFQSLRKTVDPYGTGNVRRRLFRRPFARRTCSSRPGLR